jgi:hypothetical protein
MIRRFPFALTVLAGASSGLAQTAFTDGSDINFYMAWSEVTSSGVPVAAPDGILEPGEFALVRISSVHYTNFASSANFSPAIGTFTSGLVTGFGTGDLDLVGAGGTVGTFINSGAGLPVGVRASWRFNGDGTVNPASDGIINLLFGQHPETPATANSTNPITSIFRMLWQPTDFAARTVTFTPQGAAAAGDLVASVYLDLDATIGGPGSGTLGNLVFVNASHLHFSRVSIPIAPAPPTLLAAAAALLVPRRRRPAP